MRTGIKSALIIIAVAGAVYITTNKQGQTEDANEVKELTTDFLGQPIEQQTQSVIVKAANETNQEIKKEIQTQFLKNCASFLKNEKIQNNEQALEAIKNQYQISDVGIDMTEYQLRTKSNEEIVVQHIPGENFKNIVRVFKTAEDGFPDRIKSYPNAKASVKLRLAGALTLGQLIKKIEKHKAVNSDGTELYYEKSKNEVIKVEFLNGQNQLICEDQLCQCNKL